MAAKSGNRLFRRRTGKAGEANLWPKRNIVAMLQESEAVTLVRIEADDIPALAGAERIGHLRRMAVSSAPLTQFMLFCSPVQRKSGMMNSL